MPAQHWSLTNSVRAVTRTCSKRAATAIVIPDAAQPRRNPALRIGGRV